MIYIKDLGRAAVMVAHLPLARPKMTDIPPSPPYPTNAIALDGVLAEALRKECCA
jgi:hypothetical protein